jgi:hypothetical protein
MTPGISAMLGFISGAVWMLVWVVYLQEFFMGEYAFTKISFVVGFIFSAAMTMLLLGLINFF